MVYDKVTLPGDSHVALLLRMTEYFERNITSVCLLKSNSTIYILSLRYPVQRTLCHCEASPIMGSPKDTLYFWGKGVCKHKTGDCRLRRLTGQKRSIRRAEGNHIIKPTQDTFVLAWGKRRTQTKEWALSLAIMWFQKCSYRGPRGILCTRGEKAQTSIRVSIAAPTMRFQQRSLRQLPCMNFGKC